MPVYKSIELVATLAAPPSHDQGLRQTWQQHIPATRSMCQYWNNLKKQPRESRSPTITQVEIPSGPPLSYLQSNEHTCQYNRTRTRTNKQSVSADPMHDELLNKTQYIWPTTICHNRSFPRYSQISARSWSNAHRWTGYYQQMQTGGEPHVHCTSPDL